MTEKICNLIVIKKILKGTKYIYISAMLLLLISICSPVVSYIYKILVDEMSRKSFSYSRMLVIVLVYLLVQIIVEIIENIQNHIQMLGELNLKDNVAHQVNEKLGKIKIDLFEDVEKYNLIERISNKLIDEIINTMDIFFVIASPIISIFTSAIILFSVEWYFPFVLIISNIPYFFILLSQNKKYYSQYKSINTLDRYLKYWIDALLNRKYAKDIRVFNLVEYLEKKIKKLQCEIFNIEYLFDKKKNILNILVSIVRNLSVGVCLGLVFYLIEIDENVTMGTFVLVYSIVHEIVNSLSVTISQLAEIENLSLYLNDWKKFMKLEEECDNIFPEDNNVEQKMRICFNNVTFSYPGQNKDTIHDLNLKIDYGEKVAIVGKNGSGKSTLINLLLGFYKVKEGKILVGGKDVCICKPEEYKQYLSCMFQDYIKFQLSIKENIFLDNEKIEYTNLNEIVDFIKDLPNGLETVLGQLDKDGEELSGGQWQKIAFARACVKSKAEIFIFDEPTANMDCVSEKRVINFLFRNLEEKTLIITTHNLELCKFCDRIIVMDNGEIVENDSFCNLMEKKGTYYDMYRSQTIL